MSNSSRDDLELQAEQLRAHLLSTAAEFERKSGFHRAYSEDDPVITEDAEDADDAVDADQTSPRAAAPARTGAAEPSNAGTPERKRLERRADKVREHLIDSVEALERKARKRLLPIVVTGSALVLVLTAGYAWMFYRTMKLSRRSMWRG